jgi:hypothetical protein
MENMRKVRDRGSSFFRTTVASPIGKLGQKTLDAGQTEVKQLWGLIERAFGADTDPDEAEGEGEEPSWEEIPQEMEEVNIFLDLLGAADDADSSDLSSSNSSPKRSRRSLTTSAESKEGKERKENGGGEKGRHQLHHDNSFVVKIKKGKDMAHKIMFSGVEKMTHLGRGHHKRKKDDAPGLIEVTSPHSLHRA